MKLTYALGAIAPMLVAAAPSFAATTIYADWEGTPDGFTHVNPLTYSSTTGVTNGTQSLVVDVPNGYNNSLRSGAGATRRDAILEGDTLQFDLTKIEGGDPLEGGGGLQVNFLLQGQTGSSAFFQRQSPVETYYAAGTYTYNWDYRADFAANGVTLPEPDGGGYINLWIITNAIGTYDPAAVYFDYLRIIGPDDERLPGDANNDGTVDVADLGILANNFRMEVTGGMDEADFNEDGTVDVTDLGILADNFRSSIGDPELAELLVAYNLGAYVSAIPEPTSIAALGAAGLLLGRRRRA